MCENDFDDSQAGAVLATKVQAMLLVIPITLALALTLQGQQPEPKASDPDDPTAPLFRAIALRDVNEVRRTLSTGADVNATNPEGVTPLMRAAMDGEVEIVETLLAAGGANVNVQSESGETALLRAALYGRAEIVKLLVARGAAVDAGDREGVTPLMAAAQQGRTDVVRALVDAGAKIGLGDKEGITPLMAAASANRTDALLLLIARGADVNAKTHDGLNAMMAAAYGGGHVGIVRSLLATGADLTVKDQRGRTICRKRVLNKGESGGGQDANAGRIADGGHIRIGGDRAVVISTAARTAASGSDEGLHVEDDRNVLCWLLDGGEVGGEAG
jgi:ankyrin repeat protein